MDPIARFKDWMKEAEASKDIPEANAMALATADANGQPSLRMVLLKAVDDGFVFYTNFGSRKSQELKTNARGALCFYWGPIGKQVRIEGRAKEVSKEDADAYFKSRDRGSQIGAWASEKQSFPLASRKDLEAEVAKYEKKFAGQDVPRPPFWSGWRITPDAMEFWQAGEHRLHERERFERHGDHWHVQTLYP